MRTVLITGATRGIGAATARLFKDAGYRVVASFYGNEQVAERFSQEANITVLKFDVGDLTTCAEYVAHIEETHGPIDVLINNAGISRDAPLHKMSSEQWDAVMRTNLTGVFNMTRATINGMRQRGFGRIINIGSINGEAGAFGLTNYSAAKAGVHGFTKALAIESAGKGITVNTIAPGYIATDLLADLSEGVMANIVASIPVGRLGRPEEIARAALFLAADDAGFITGTCLSINGGQHMY